MSLVSNRTRLPRNISMILHAPSRDAAIWRSDNIITGLLEAPVLKDVHCYVLVVLSNEVANRSVCSGKHTTCVHQSVALA